MLIPRTWHSGTIRIALMRPARFRDNSPLMRHFPPDILPLLPNILARGGRVDIRIKESVAVRSAVIRRMAEFRVLEDDIEDFNSHHGTGVACFTEDSARLVDCADELGYRCSALVDHFVSDGDSMEW